MKKKSFALMLAAALTAIPLTAQTDSNGNDQEPVDEIELFSDTTQDTSAVATPMFPDDEDFDFGFDDPDFDEEPFRIDSMFDNLDNNSIMGMFFVLAVLLVIFVLMPIAIIGLILWFVYKNRKERMRLAEMAMMNGQPIPQEFVRETPTEGNDEVRKKGVRQIFLGIGLIFFLGWLVGKVGAGIGIVVLCVGLGNVLIARTARKKEDNLP